VDGAQENTGSGGKKSPKKRMSQREDEWGGQSWRVSIWWFFRCTGGGKDGKGGKKKDKKYHEKGIGERKKVLSKGVVGGRKRDEAG